MPGQLVPTVLLPRYTTVAGPASTVMPFTTVAMDVTPYDLALITVWRGQIVGTTPPGPALPFKLWCESSTDQIEWQVCPGSPNGADIGVATQRRLRLELTRRWFRIRIELGATDNVVTVWAAGSLQERER